jgi:hypothetical protein
VKRRRGYLKKKIEKHKKKASKRHCCIRISARKKEFYVIEVEKRGSFVMM